MLLVGTSELVNVILAGKVTEKQISSGDCVPDSVQLPIGVMPSIRWIAWRNVHSVVELLSVVVVTVTVPRPLGPPLAMQTEAQQAAPELGYCRISYCHLTMRA